MGSPRNALRSKLSNRCSGKREHWNIVLGSDDSVETQVKDSTDLNTVAENVSLRRERERERKKCDDCGSLFAGTSSLNKHIRGVHLKLRPHPCSACHKSFLHISALETHFRSVHLRLQPFKCPHCYRNFSDKSNMRKHIFKVHFPSLQINQDM